MIASEYQVTIQNRKHFRLQYGELFKEVEKILFNYDPMGIAFLDDSNGPENPDEYSPETAMILSRLKEANSEGDVLDIVHEVFIHWFSDEATAGPKANYQNLSAEIWAVWNRIKSRSR